MMELWEIIALSTVVALVGVVFGAKVQKAVKFIYPFDLITWSLCTICLMDYALYKAIPGPGLFPIDKFWYLPLLLGYATGYLVVGRTSYVMVQTISLANKTMTSDPWVIWERDGQIYTQEQSNLALIRRIFFGIRHEIITNSPMDEDWTVTVDIPLFPLISKRTVMAEDVVSTWVPVRIFWRFYVKKWTTYITLAYGGMVSKAQLAHDEKFLYEMQKQNTNLVAAVHELRSEQGPMLMEMALKLEQKIVSTAPVNRMFSLIKRKPEVKNGSSEEAAGEAQS